MMIKSFFDQIGIAAPKKLLQNSFIIYCLSITLLVVFITRELNKIQHCVLTILSEDV